VLSEPVRLESCAADGVVVAIVLAAVRPAANVTAEPLGSGAVRDLGGTIGQDIAQHETCIVWTWPRGPIREKVLIAPSQRTVMILKGTVSAGSRTKLPSCCSLTRQPDNYLNSRISAA
jgi:hypothetical protein